MKKRRIFAMIVWLTMIINIASSVPFAVADSLGDNLFDPASCEVGWIDGDGVRSPDASFRTSAAIPVEEGDEISTLARRYPIRAGTSSPWTPARM